MCTLRVSSLLTCSLIFLCKSMFTTNPIAFYLWLMGLYPCNIGHFRFSPCNFFFDLPSVKKNFDLPPNRPNKNLFYKRTLINIFEEEKFGDPSSNSEIYINGPHNQATRS